MRMSRSKRRFTSANRIEIRRTNGFRYRMYSNRNSKWRSSSVSAESDTSTNSNCNHQGELLSCRRRGSTSFELITYKLHNSGNSGRDDGKASRVIKLLIFYLLFLRHRNWKFAGKQSSRFHSYTPTYLHFTASAKCSGDVVVSWPRCISAFTWYLEIRCR